MAHLPPVSTLFAAFLGYNPMQHLLGPSVLAHLPPGRAAVLQGRSFFPHLISSPFRHGLHTAFDFAIGACLVAAAASWSPRRVATSTPKRGDPTGKGTRPPWTRQRRWSAQFPDQHPGRGRRQWGLGLGPALPCISLTTRPSGYLAMNRGRRLSSRNVCDEIPGRIRKYAGAHGLDIDSYASDGWYCPASTLPIRLTAANTGKSGPHDPPTFLTWAASRSRRHHAPTAGRRDRGRQRRRRGHLGECPQVRDRSAAGWVG